MYTKGTSNVKFYQYSSSTMDIFILSSSKTTTQEIRYSAKYIRIRRSAFSIIPNHYLPIYLKIEVGKYKRYVEFFKEICYSYTIMSVYLYSRY